MGQVSILSVGSDETLLYTRNEILHQNGFHVVPARNRHEAVLACQGNGFDLALLCHSMPPDEAESLARDLEIVSPSVQVVNLGAWDHVGLVEIRKPEFLLQVLQSLLAKRDGDGDGHLLARSGKGDGHARPGYGDGHAGRVAVAKRSKEKAPPAGSTGDATGGKQARNPARPSEPKQP